MTRLGTLPGLRTWPVVPRYHVYPTLICGRMTGYLTFRTLPSLPARFAFMPLPRVQRYQPRSIVLILTINYVTLPDVEHDYTVG